MSLDRIDSSPVAAAEADEPVVLIVSLPATLARRLSALAAALGEDISDVSVDALALHLDHVEAEVGAAPSPIAAVAP